MATTITRSKPRASHQRPTDEAVAADLAAVAAALSRTSSAVDDVTAIAVSEPRWETVTPEIAAQWLETNNDNRRIRSAHVAALTRDMVAGAFRPAGDPIRFDTAGRLIDGQHRLMAVVASGTTHSMLILRNLPAEVQQVIDTGIARSSGDALAFAGVANRYNVASVVRLAIAREEGLFGNTRETKQRGRVTNSEILAWVQAHPDVLEVLPPALGVARAIAARPTSAWIYGSWVLNRIDSKAYQEFSDSLYNAATGGAGDPRALLIQYLRRRLETPAMFERGASQGQLLYLMFRTWNAWRDGENLTRLIPAGKNPSRGAVIPDPH